jgi:(1->4)-alpha-D-glucan 1-alpha-D-glucosylmutase
MLATSTHDTKRSEDVRARINVLSEIPDEWRLHLKNWSRINQKYRTGNAPSRNLEYLFYQTILGCLDSKDVTKRKGIIRIKQEFIQRIAGYIRKSAKEANEETSWIDSDEQYETDVENFIHQSLSSENRFFLQEFVSFSEKIRKLGVFNSISQVVLKITGPGVPDFYQGTEFFDYSLVDPDNRRPVDYEKRKAVLNKIKNTNFKLSSSLRIGSREQNDEAKLLATMVLLNYRKQNQDLFEKGNYLPLKVTGPRKNHVVAFRRMTPAKQLLVFSTRFFHNLTEGGKKMPIGGLWSNNFVELPELSPDPSYYTNILTGEKFRSENRSGHSVIKLTDAFSSLPYAVLDSD